MFCIQSCLLSKNTKIKRYGTVTLSAVLYGCETWSVTLREEDSLRVFENWVLRKIFGHKMDEVTGEWTKLHNEELRHLYSAIVFIWVIKSRRLIWGGHVARMGEREAHSLQGFGGEIRRKKDNLEDLRVDGRIILKNIYIFILTLLGT